MDVRFPCHNNNILLMMTRSKSLPVSSTNMTSPSFLTSAHGEWIVRWLKLSFNHTQTISLFISQFLTEGRTCIRENHSPLAERGWVCVLWMYNITSTSECIIIVSERALVCECVLCEWWDSVFCVECEECVLWVCVCVFLVCVVCEVACVTQLCLEPVPS